MEMKGPNDNPDKLICVSFLDEAFQGIKFFSAQVDSFPHHEWPKAMRAMKTNQ